MDAKRWCFSDGSFKGGHGLIRFNLTADSAPPLPQPRGPWACQKAGNWVKDGDLGMASEGPSLGIRVYVQDMELERCRGCLGLR